MEAKKSDDSASSNDNMDERPESSFSNEERQPSDQALGVARRPRLLEHFNDPGSIDDELDTLAFGTNNDDRKP